jgi:hypothetical protein
MIERGYWFNSNIGVAWKKNGDNEFMLYETLNTKVMPLEKSLKLKLTGFETDGDK